MTKPSTYKISKNNNMIMVAIVCFVIAALCFFPSQEHISNTVVMFSAEALEKYQSARMKVKASYFIAGLGGIFLLAGLLRKD